jgi:hypothetical protein
MSNPKFSIGDKVAVCTADLSIVIPATVVLDRRWSEGARIITGNSPALYTGWSYLVAGAPLFGREYCLRPILPGEYLTTSEESHSGIPA